MTDYLCNKYKENVQNTDKAIQHLCENIEKCGKRIAGHNDNIRRRKQVLKLSKSAKQEIAYTKECIDIKEIYIYIPYEKPDY